MARLALYVGLVLTAAGGVVLYLGYNGTATHPNLIQQMPYIFSGGFTAVVLIVLGAAAVMTSLLMTAQSQVREGLEALNSTIQEMTESFSHRAFDAASTSPLDGAIMVSVSRGASSFHKASCRLVASKRSLRTLPREEAERTGLAACRVCRP